MNFIECEQLFSKVQVILQKITEVMNAILQSFFHLITLNNNRKKEGSACNQKYLKFCIRNLKSNTNQVYNATDHL